MGDYFGRTIGGFVQFVSEKMVFLLSPALLVPSFYGFTAKLHSKVLLLTLLIEMGHGVDGWGFYACMTYLLPSLSIYLGRRSASFLTDL